MRLAETLLILGRLEEAETHIRLVQGRKPEDPRALFDAGLVAVSREDWQMARTQLLGCLGSPLTRKKARVQLGRRLPATRRCAGAPKSFARKWTAFPPTPIGLIRSSPNTCAGVTNRNRYRLAEQLESAGRLTEAAAMVRPMTAAHPDDYLPYLALGKVLAQTPENREAEQALRQALHLAPDKVQTHYYLALLLVKEGEALGDDGQAHAQALFREAAELARQALAIKPDYGYAQMALGLALKHLGRISEAISALRQAVHSNPEFAELHLQLGEALADQGQEPEARPSLEQALWLAPPDAPWRQQVQARLAKMH